MILERNLLNINGCNFSHHWFQIGFDHFYIEQANLQ